MALMHFMRLSLWKGAHAALSRVAWQEIRVGMTKGRVALPSRLVAEGLQGCAFRCGSQNVIKNGFCSATALHGRATLPFVIPSVAEGSAVQRTFPGNVFDWSRGGCGFSIT
jgi:hypothetical protein